MPTFITSRVRGTRSRIVVVLVIALHDLWIVLLVYHLGYNFRFRFVLHFWLLFRNVAIFGSLSIVFAQHPRPFGWGSALWSTG